MNPRKLEHGLMMISGSHFLASTCFIFRAFRVSTVLAVGLRVLRLLGGSAFRACAFVWASGLDYRA